MGTTEPAVEDRSCDPRAGWAGCSAAAGSTRRGARGRRARDRRRARRRRRGGRDDGGRRDEVAARAQRDGRRPRWSSASRSSARGRAARAPPPRDQRLDDARVRRDPGEGGAGDHRVRRPARPGRGTGLASARPGAAVADARALEHRPARAAGRRRRHLPWNFPLVLAMRSVAPALALGNAVVLKADPNTPVSGGVIIARLFEEAGLPDGVLHVLAGGADGPGARRGPARADDLVHGLHGHGRVVGEAAGAHAEADRARARRQQRARRPRRCRRRRRLVRGGLGVVPAPGPDLPGGEPPPRAREHRRGLPRRARRPRPPAGRRQPGDRATWRSARSSTSGRSTACSGSSTRASRRARRRSRAASRTACSSRRRCSPTSSRDARVRGGDLRPGRARRAVLRRR